VKRFARPWAIVVTVLAIAGAPSAQASATPGGVDKEGALSEYTMGVFMLESGRPQEAIPYLESAWELSSKDETIGNKLAEAYFRAGDLGSCDRTLDHLLAKNNKNSGALFLKARIDYFRGELEGAVQHLLRLREFSEPSFEVERLLGRIQLELGQFDDALTAYQNAVRLDPGDPIVRFRYGMLLKRFGRRAEAEKAFRNAIGLQPLFAEAVVELAEILIEEERFDEAEAALLKLLDQEGDFYEALIMTANLLADRGKLEQAIKLLKEREERDSLHREGVLLLGKLHYQADDFSAAVELFKKLFTGDDQTAEMSRVLGELYVKTGQSDSALFYYQKAIDLEPENYRNYVVLFFASSSRLGGEGDAVIELTADKQKRLLSEAAAKVARDDFDGAYILGVAHDSLDDLEEARKFFEKALELRPQHERTLLNLASVLERTGRYAEAETHLTTLHELRPNDPTVCNFYGYLLALMNTRLDQAEQLIRTALKSEPDNGYYVDSLGWVFYMRGEYERAVAELERASGLVADDPVILEHLGDAYQSLKRFREALAAYRKSMDIQGENSKILDKIDATRILLGN